MYILISQITFMTWKVMQMDINQLREIEVYRKTNVLAGESGLSNEVLNVTITDAPDAFPWYRTGDFIVTTGYPFTSNKDWKEGLWDFLNEVVKRGGAGIGIKMGRYIPYLPDRVIKFADQNHFPILELPGEPSWTDIIVPAITEINKQQKYELEMTHKVYKRFQTLLKNGSSLEELAELLENFMDCPVTIYIRAFNLIVNTSGVELSQGKVEEIISGITAAPDHTARTIYTHREDFTVRWNYNASRLVSTVFVWGLNAPLSAWKKAALEQMAIITSVETERLRTIANTYQHFRNDFLDTLLSEHTLKREVILRRAKEVDWEMKDRYKVVILDCPEDNTNEGDLPESQRKLNILGDFTNELRWLLPKTLTGLDSQNHLILLVTEDVDEGTISKNLKLMAERLKIKIIVGGLGRTSELESLNSSYKEALLALKVAETEAQGAPRKDMQLWMSDFARLDVERILFSEDPRSESEKLVKEYLHKVIEYDEKNGGEILTTLKTFINNNANYDATAKVMFVHKNTVRYRINKIRKLTTLDPDKMKDLMLLQLAVTAHDLG